VYRIPDVSRPHENTRADFGLDEPIRLTDTGRVLVQHAVSGYRRWADGAPNDCWYDVNGSGFIWRGVTHHLPNDMRSYNAMDDWLLITTHAPTRPHWLKRDILVADKRIEAYSRKWVVCVKHDELAVFSTRPDRVSRVFKALPAYIPQF